MYTHFVIEHGFVCIRCDDSTFENITQDVYNITPSIFNFNGIRLNTQVIQDVLQACIYIQ